MAPILMAVLIFCLSPHPHFDLEWGAFVDHTATPKVEIAKIVQCEWLSAIENAPTKVLGNLVT